MDTEGFPLSFEDFLLRLAKHEKEIRVYFGAEKDFEVGEALDEIVSVATPDSVNYWEGVGNYPDTGRLGIRILTTVRMLQEILALIPEQIPNELAAALINVTFQSGYELGLFSKQVEMDIISSPDEVERLLKYVRFHHPEGRKDKEAALRKHLREVYVRKLPQGQTHLPWIDLYNAFLKEGNNGSEFSKIRKDNKYIYFTHNGEEDSRAIGTFKNIRREIEKDLKKTITPIDKP